MRRFHVKLSVIASALLIVSAILYSARFITSALIGIIMNGMGDDIYYPHTQPLLILSIITLVVAVLLFLIDYFKK